MLAMSMVAGIAHADNKRAGFYAGVNTGFAFNQVQLKAHHEGFVNLDGIHNTSANFSTFSPGIQLGYMYSLPNSFISSIEANFTLNTNQKVTLDCNSDLDSNAHDRFTFRNRMQASLKGRVGRVLNSFLPYLTAGVSFAHMGLSYENEIGDHSSNNVTQAGWLIGTGIEWAFQKNWSLRAEYFYVDYGDTIYLNIPSVYGLFDANGYARVDLKSHNASVALNYWLHD